MRMVRILLFSSISKQFGYNIGNSMHRNPNKVLKMNTRDKILGKIKNARGELN